MLATDRYYYTDVQVFWGGQMSTSQVLTVSITI